MNLTYARRIEALGGTQEGSGEYNAGYHDGYSRAIEAAIEIGADADEMIDEMIETIEDILNGHRTLIQWAEAATLLLSRIKSRTV